MKQGLVQYKQERNTGTFTAKFIRYGEVKSTKQKTALLLYLKDSTGKQLTDHVWVKCSDLGRVENGDWIQFWAYVSLYEKGSGNVEIGVMGISNIKVTRRLNKEKIDAKQDLIEKLKANHWGKK